MGKWKLIRTKQNIPFELYDLSKDIGEKNNLADSYPQIVKKMTAIAESQHDEPVPQTEPKAPGGKRFI